MARGYFSNLELHLNQLLDAVLHNSSGPPSSGPVAGQVYHDTVTHQDYLYDGQKWTGDADEGLFWMEVGP